MFVTTRAVVRHVRYWRGAIHRWSTVYQFVGTPSSPLTVADAQSVLNADGAMCYPGLNGDSGIYECSLYNQASGGVPLVTFIQGNWEEPGTWVPPSGSAWDEGGQPLAEPAESALLVEWKAGTSKSGKPVLLRKWFHSVPPSVSNAGSPDIAGQTPAYLKTGATTLQNCLGSKGLSMGSSTGRLAGSPSVSTYYGNHQMSRGRRKKTSASQTSSQYSEILSAIDALAAGAVGTG